MRRKLSTYIILGVVGLAALTNFIVGSLQNKNAQFVPNSSTSPDFNQIDAYVQAELQTAGVPGAALAIVHGDQIVHLKGFGVAGSSNQAVTPQTPFMIGSENKSITALGVMQLVQAGKVSLDAVVQQYIPWFRMADPSARITIQELLDQTSGISTADGVAYLRLDDLSDQALENRVRALSTVKLVNAPGTTYHYSNANYDILGLVIQIVSGQPYDHYIQEHIFDPLGMTHSTFLPQLAQQNGLAEGYSNIYIWIVPRQHHYNRGLIASGAMLSSSAEDMAHFLMAQLNDGNYQSVSVLSAQQMAVLHLPGAKMGSPSQTYSSGWIHYDLNGTPVLAHSGVNYSAHASMYLVPGARWGVILLMNADNYWQFYLQDYLGAGITSLLLGHSPITNVQPNDTYIILFFLIAVLIYAIVSSGRNAVHWLSDPQSRPHRLLPVITQVFLPLAAGLGCAYMVLVNFQQTVGGGLSYPDIIFAHPDVGYTVLITGILSLLYSVIWLGLVGKIYWNKSPRQLG